MSVTRNVRRSSRRLIPVAVCLSVTALGASACAGHVSASQVDPNRNAHATHVALTITQNAVHGGVNSQLADWLTSWVIPRFEQQEKQHGVQATVTFEPSGASGTDYLSKLELELRSRTAPDIIGLDGIDIGGLATANYLQPLSKIVGSSAYSSWSGWGQIKPSVRAGMTYQNQLYGLPNGVDGRVLFYNKTLFAQAGLPTTWQPTSWADILTAARALAKLHGVTPVQLDAGTAMGEATTTQGLLPLLAGTGEELYQNGKWAGDTSGIRQALGLYQQIYSAGLGDRSLQEEAQGREQSFERFAAGKIGIYLESDYLWRTVLPPKVGTDPMANRDSAVGYALIPAERPGAGVHGQNYVSLSGGTGSVLNPATKYPQQAWQLLEFMTSKQALVALYGSAPRLTPRADVNQAIAGGDPMLTFLNAKVLPITTTRPSSADYNDVSTALQQATEDVVVGGMSPAAAAAKYQKALVAIVGSRDVESN